MYELYHGSRDGLVSYTCASHRCTSSNTGTKTSSPSRSNSTYCSTTSNGGRRVVALLLRVQRPTLRRAQELHQPARERDLAHAITARPRVLTKSLSTAGCQNREHPHPRSAWPLNGSLSGFRKGLSLIPAGDRAIARVRGHDRRAADRLPPNEARGPRDAGPITHQMNVGGGPDEEPGSQGT